MDSKEREQKLDVLIVGAGIAGMALYHALDKKKFNVEIVEKESAMRSLGYSVILAPSGVAALKVLGFSSHAIRNLGRSINIFQLRDVRGVLGNKRIFKDISEHPDSAMNVDREKLHNVLESTIPAERVFLNTDVLSFCTVKHGACQVIFRGKKKSKEYNIVVGADGASSSVRKLIFPKPTITYHGVTFAWTWIPRRTFNFKEAVVFENGEVGIGVFDSGQQQSLCVFLFATNTPKRYEKIIPKHFEESIREKLNQFASPIRTIVPLLPPSTAWYIHQDKQVDMRFWHKGNVCLIGDAAHARTAFSGAGSAFALEDGLVLGRLLNEEETIARAFKRFQKRQKPRAVMLDFANISSFEKTTQALRRWLKSSPLL